MLTRVMAEWIFYITMGGAILLYEVIYVLARREKLRFIKERDLTAVPFIIFIMLLVVVPLLSLATRWETDTQAEGTKLGLAVLGVIGIAPIFIKVFD